MHRWYLLIPVLSFLVACLPNNSTLVPEQNEATVSEIPLEVEVAREGVFFVVENDRQPVSAADQVTEIQNNDGLSVDRFGRAFVRVGDRMTLELLRNAELPQIQHVSDGQTSTVSVAQNGGTLIADLTLQPGVQNNLTIQTAFGTVVAQNARLAVVREVNSPLEWVLGLEVGDGGLLTVSAGGITVPIAAGQTRWITSSGEPSAAIVIGDNAQAWLEGARNNIEQPEIGAVLLPPADIIADSSRLSAVPQPGRPTELWRDVHGAINLTLDPVGIFGSPGYSLEDCDGDGSPELVIVDGIVDFDFSSLLARVTALDVTIINRAGPERGLLRAFGPSGTGAAQIQASGVTGETETLSLRSDHPFHSAQLTVGNACLLGISLTPPTETGTLAEARVIGERARSETVINVLAGSGQPAAQGDQLRAIRLASNTPTVDGQLDDWNTLVARTGIEWSSISNLVYDSACSKRFPGNETAVDFAGEVLFAYDDTYLFVAFQVTDDGFVPYTGADNRFFLGDGPQLLLDLDLNGDLGDAGLSEDDLQIDFLPQPGAPQVALWQLSTLTSNLVANARAAVSATATGYIVEAAVPWTVLGGVPQSGDQLGIVAGINDNDTPDTNNQECIIASVPQRDWQNPTTWGTLLLMPGSDD
jgi:hypothetical protein